MKLGDVQRIDVVFHLQVGRGANRTQQFCRVGLLGNDRTRFDVMDLGEQLRARFACVDNHHRFAVASVLANVSEQIDATLIGQLHRRDHGVKLLVAPSG